MAESYKKDFSLVLILDCSWVVRVTHHWKSSSRGQKKSQRFYKVIHALGKGCLGLLLLEYLLTLGFCGSKIWTLALPFTCHQEQVPHLKDRTKMSLSTLPGCCEEQL